MNQLIKYDAACRALSEAKAVDEVKDIRDRAEAMRVYARQAKNRTMEVDAAEIRLRAERRVGEMIVAQKETVGLATGGQPYQATPANEAGVELPTLADAGIDYKMSSRSQKLAAVPVAEFEGMIGEWRDRVSDENEKITVNLLRAGENAKRSAENANIKPVAAPVGLYETIVIDPPWPMEKIERDVRPNQTKALDYPTMDEAELRGLCVPVAENAHLFLWTTHKFLPMAFRLLETWEFRYVCLLTWHKPGGFQPVGLPQYNSEFVVYARHGRPGFVDTKRFNTCFTGARGAHSRKPTEFYDLVARVTGGPRLDMFAREPRDGFEIWGNQA